MLKCLPPVGNPVLLNAHAAPTAVFSDVFAENEAYLYGSGTMALAAALIAARDLHATVLPEVLIPAYACPDLVSAAIYAGLKPILVDLVAGYPWMDLDKLQQLIGPNTVAIIAAHFLGIPERLQDIREVIVGTDVILVEDSAQLFPSVKTDATWQGDLVVLSFGRGKPVSLFGGGAVLSRHLSLSRLLPEAEAARLVNIEGSQASRQFKLKVKTYNALLTPLAYGVLKRAPFLHLGQTLYKPLQSITPFGAERVAVLATNISAYQERDRPVQVWISEMLASVTGDAVLDLPRQSQVPSVFPLLRYPVLIRSRQLRDHLDAALSHAGLGCTRMYDHSLPEIEGLKNMLSQQAGFPQARDFANRLLTLPCHLGVSKKHISKIRDIIEKTLLTY